jgi:hypothetical protein
MFLHLSEVSFFVGGPGWRSSEGAALLVGRSRDRFPMVSLDFSVTYFLPGVDSAPSENEYQEHFLGSKGGRCVRLTISPHSHAECHEIWEPKPGTLWATPGLLRDSFTFTFTFIILCRLYKLILSARAKVSLQLTTTSLSDLV